MRQVQIPRYGGPEVLSIVEAADPDPGQVRIAVRAAGINFADILARAQCDQARRSRIAIGRLALSSRACAP